MPVLVSRRARNSAALPSAPIKRLGERMLSFLELPDAELSILLCDDALIHEINLEHRNKDKPTDVLSFPQAEFIEPEVVAAPHSLHLLGDVVISIDTAERQAASRKRPLFEEVRFLLGHGVLHLLGYDHMVPSDKAVMTKRARQLIRAVSN